jgi:hypothetical protein
LKRAGDLDRSPHHFCQTLADGETESRAAESVCRVAVRLRERLEKPFLAGIRDPVAGIAHRDAHRIDALLPVDEDRGNRYLAFHRELDRVRDEIIDDLPHAQRIELQRRADIGIDSALEEQSFAAGATEIDVARALEHLTQRRGHDGNLQLSRLDLGKVENVVDDAL